MFLTHFIGSNVNSAHDFPQKKTVHMITGIKSLKILTQIELIIKEETLSKSNVIGVR